MRQQPHRYRFRHLVPGLHVRSDDGGLWRGFASPLDALWPRLLPRRRDSLPHRGPAAEQRLAQELGGALSSPWEQPRGEKARRSRSEEHTSELQSLMRISYAVFCLKKKNNNIN